MSYVCIKSFFFLIIDGSSRYFLPFFLFLKYLDERNWIELERNIFFFFFFCSCMLQATLKNIFWNIKTCKNRHTTDRIRNKRRDEMRHVSSLSAMTSDKRWRNGYGRSRSLTRKIERRRWRDTKGSRDCKERNGIRRDKRTISLLYTRLHFKI